MADVPISSNTGLTRAPLMEIVARPGEQLSEADLGVLLAELPEFPEGAVPAGYQQAREVRVRIRKLGALFVALRQQGYTTNEIAEMTSVPRATIVSTLAAYRKAGQLVDSAAEILDHKGAALAAERMVEACDKGEQWAVEGLLKGRGHLRTYSHVDGGALNGAVQVAVQVIMPPGVDVQLAGDGQVVGVPRSDVVEGEIDG